MRLDQITVGMLAIIVREGHARYGEEGRVLSIFSDYGNSKVVSIRLELDEGIVVHGLQPEDLAP